MTTFCDFYEGCKHGKSCRRDLTPERVERLQKAWGKDDPILSHFAVKPEYFKKETKT